MDDSSSRYPTSTDCCVQVKGDVGRLCLILANHFVQSKGGTGRTRLMSIHHCVDANGGTGRQIQVLTNHCVQDKDDA